MSTEQYATLAAAIADELKHLGWWPDGLGDEAPPAEVLGAFGQPDMAFTDWLARVLVPRLREVGAGEADPPARSMVATQAIRELDGAPDAQTLIGLLADLDALVERG